MRILTVAAIAVAIAGLAAVFSLRSEASDGGSQMFMPERYALVQANINVAMLNPGTGANANMQNVLFKLDSTTGEVWALQMTVVSGNDPSVQNASWFKVGNIGSSPSAPQQSMPTPNSGMMGN